MAPSGLPKGDSPSLRLDRPTDKEKVEQWSKNAVTWRGALSLEAYHRREEYLLKVPLAKDEGLTHWVLVDSDAEDRKVFAGCETLNKKAVMANDGKVVDSVCHTIGNVFTAPEFRGKGYGQRLMKELGPRLETWQTGNTQCLFSILYSDIGESFYAKTGWHPFPSPRISISAETNASGSCGTASLLYANELAALCKADEKLIRQYLESLDSKAIKPTVAIIPDIATMQWHHAREEFVANELYGKVPTVKGAIAGSEVGQRVWCYWTRTWYNEDGTKSEGNTLFILRLVVEDETAPDVASAIASLFAAALAEAKAWHLAEVLMWNPSDLVITAAKMLDPQATVVQREASIPSLRWHGDVDDPDCRIPATQQCDWIHNEKYGWC
ncbi:MAG: hypothetical protein M1821_000399 [Bathelium mastoideum]|nr:MAG: hypothetical protein M1821_000399 [Bathelium mastoideum]